MIPLPEKQNIHEYKIRLTLKQPWSLSQSIFENSHEQYESTLKKKQIWMRLV